MMPSSQRSSGQGCGGTPKSGSQFSFQVWIERGTVNIWFVYGPQTGSLSTATVGLENLHGSVGFMEFYNGGGSAPQEGTTLKAIHFVDQAKFTYAFEFASTIGLAVTNTAQAFNHRTESVISSDATIRIANFIFLPISIR